MSLKNPVTPPRIDPGTVRLEAQRLNHYATSGPLLSDVVVIYLKSILVLTPNGQFLDCATFAYSGPGIDSAPSENENQEHSWG